MRLETRKADDDWSFDIDGVTILVDPITYPMIDSVNIDFIDTLTHTGFRLIIRVPARSVPAASRSPCKGCFCFALPGRPIPGPTGVRQQDAAFSRTRDTPARRMRRAVAMPRGPIMWEYSDKVREHFSTRATLAAGRRQMALAMWVDPVRDALRLMLKGEPGKRSHRRRALPDLLLRVLAIASPPALTEMIIASPWTRRKVSTRTSPIFWMACRQKNALLGDGPRRSVSGGHRPLPWVNGKTTTKKARWCKCFAVDAR